MADAARPRHALETVIAFGLFVCAGAAIIWATRTHLVVGCESDGHYIMAQYLRCGEMGLYVQMGKGTWPWLYPFIVGHIAGIFGAATYWVGKLVTLAAGAGIVALVTHAASREIPGRARWIAPLVVAANPQFLMYSTLASTDVFAALFVALGLWFGSRAVAHDGGARDAALAGAAWAIAGLTRYQYVPPAPFALAAIALAVPSVRRRGPMMAGAFALAWLGVSSIGLVGGFSNLSDALGWSQVLGRAENIPNSVGTLDWSFDSAWRVARAYALAVDFVAWHVAYYPLLGLVAFGVAARRNVWRLRQLAALGIPLTAYFVAVGWFVSMDGNTDLRRVFLPFIPATAVVFAAGAAWVVRPSGARFIGWLIVPSLVAFHVNGFFIEYPLLHVWPEGHPVAARHAWTGQCLVRSIQCPAPTDEVEAVRIAREFARREQPDCRLTVTNSAPAAIELPLSYACPPGSPPCEKETGLDNAAMGKLVEHFASREPARYVLEFPQDGATRLVPGEAIGSRGLFELAEKPPLPPARVFEIVPR